MKKILLGTTALIGAAALFSGAALAEAPKVTLGGVADFQAGFVSDDLDSDQDSHAFRNDTEININVDGKSDNGLGYGAVVDLEADVSGDVRGQGFNAARTYVYLEGGWGRFELGSNEGSEDTLKVDASNIARATGGIDGDWVYFANTPGGFIATPDLPVAHGSVFSLGDELTNNNNKITYYSPRFSGFQLGLSYAPDLSDRGQVTSRADNIQGHARDIFSGGLNYEGQWNDVGINAALTGSFGDSDVAALEDIQAWNAGIGVTFAGFSVAGSYGDWQDSLNSSSADDSDYWTLGGAYDFGPFGASVTYLNSTLDLGAVENDLDNIVVGADYKLAEGLTPYAEVSFYDMDPDVGTDNEGTVFIVGTELAF